MESSDCHRTDHMSVVRVRTNEILCGYSEYSAFAVGYVGQVEIRTGGLVGVHLERQLRRFTRLNPAVHSCTTGWADAIRHWQSIDNSVSSLGNEAVVEALPVSLMREAASQRLSPGVDDLDNLCAAVMLASGCAVSAHTFEDSLDIAADDLEVPFPWVQATCQGSRIGAAGISANARTVLCISGVSGSDFELAKTLVDVLLRRECRVGSSLCWTDRMSGCRPSVPLHWRRERVIPSFLLA